jgi:LytS/YehU family sensor histidine kinase
LNPNKRITVPHLILQLLVENARHGIMPARGLAGWNQRLRGGPHFELKPATMVRPPASGTPEREGIGLKNVRSRLAQLYGGAQEFTLGNASGGGVEARIRIPCCTIPRSQAPRVVVMSETEAAQAGLSLPTAASAKPKCC